MVRITNYMIEESSGILNFLIILYAGLLSVFSFNAIPLDATLGQIGYFIVGAKIGDYIKDVNIKKTIRRDVHALNVKFDRFIEEREED